jgi:hypothetical protein
MLVNLAYCLGAHFDTRRDTGSLREALEGRTVCQVSQSAFRWFSTVENGLIFVRHPSANKVTNTSHMYLSLIAYLEIIRYDDCS